MRATLDALHDHVAIVDASGVVVAVNGTWRRYAMANGFSAPRHGVGMNYLEVCDRASAVSSEAAEVARGLRELIAGGREAVQVEYACHGPGGMRWFVASLSRFAGEGPLHVVVSHADITARKRAEQALAVEKALVEATLDNIPVQVSMLGPDGRVRWANREAGRLLGRAPETLVGDSLKAVYGLGDAEVEALYAGASTVGPRYLQGFPVRTPRGEVACDLALRRVPDGVVLLGVDVSARVMNERLQQAQIETLRQMDALKDEFLGSVSHEFRAPLHAIMGIANILATEVDGPLSDRQRKDMADLLASADDLAHLVDDLLALSQLRAGRFSLNPRPADLKAIGESVLAGMGPLAAMGDRVLVLDAPEPLPAVIDEARVAQVLRNLVHNAIKFTHPLGRITLRLRLEEGVLRGEVEDDGIGVEAADFERLFERFSQLEAGKAAGGTGLGLSICKGLVEAQGGAIGLSSEPGRGSTFWFTLPVGVAAGAAAGR
jgi:PAS domain S-box-containing protein